MPTRLNDAILATYATPDATAAFVPILKAIPRALESRLRYLRDPGTHDDLLAESYALGWRFHLIRRFHELTEQLPTRVYARQAVQAALRGRKVAGRPRDTDLFDRTCQAKRAFVVHELRDEDQCERDGIGAALVDAHGHNPLERVAMRDVLSRFLGSLPARWSKVALVLAEGYTPAEAEPLCGFHHDTISLHRSRWKLDWSQELLA